MDNVTKAEFAHMIIEAVNDLEKVRDKVKKHKRGNSIYAAQICNYIAVAQQKIQNECIPALSVVYDE